MSKLPIASGREVASALSKIGYVFDRQRGSHMILRQIESPFRRVVVPDHKDVAKGTLRGILKQTGLSVEAFRDLL